MTYEKAVKLLTSPQFTNAFWEAYYSTRKENTVSKFVTPKEVCDAIADAIYDAIEPIKQRLYALERKAPSTAAPVPIGIHEHPVSTPKR